MSDSYAPKELAVRCAEEFIIRNGYTKQAVKPEDIVTEYAELALSSAHRIEMRRNTLHPRAVAVCEAVRHEDGYGIMFNHKEIDHYLRIVTMTGSFESLRMEHQGNHYLDLPLYGNRCELLNRFDPNRELSQPN